jgi:hypothetical protein
MSLGWGCQFGSVLSLYANETFFLYDNHVQVLKVLPSGTIELKTLELVIIS